MKLNRKKVTGIIVAAAAAACVIFGAARQGGSAQPDPDNGTAAALTEREQEYLDSLATGRTAEEAFTETMDADEEAPAPTVGGVVRSHGIMAQTISNVALVDRDGTRRLANIQLVQSAKGSEDGLRDAAQELAGIGSDGTYGNSVLLIMEDPSAIKTDEPMQEEKSAADAVMGFLTVDAHAASVGDVVTIQYDNGGSWVLNSHFFRLSDGTKAYCLSADVPSKLGSYTVTSQLGSGSQLAKIAYYSPGGPGYDAAWRACFTQNYPPDYITAHLILSRTYTGTWASVLKNRRSVRDYCNTVMNALLALPDPPAGWTFCIFQTGSRTQPYGFGTMPAQGKFRIKKVSKDSSVTAGGAYSDRYAFEGAVFTVKNSAGRTAATLTTGADGYTEYTPLLESGTYTVQETEAPKGYKKNDTPWTVEVAGQTEGFTSTITEDYYRFGGAVITKTDEGTGTVLTDAEFTLYEWNGSKYVEKSIIKDTNKDGKYETGTLQETDTNKGKFRIAETTAPENHTITDEWKKGKEFTLKDDNSTFSFTCEDPGSFGIAMTKTDENGNILAKGDAVFRLYQMTKNGSYGDAGTLSWDAASKTYRKTGIKITADNLGIFRVDEEKAPAGYMGGTSISFTVPGDIRKGTVINLTGADKSSVKVSDGGLVTLTAENKEAEPVAQIRITKTDAKTGAAIDDGAFGTAVFRVYSYDTETKKYDKVAVDRMPYDSATHTYYTPVTWRDGTDGIAPADGVAKANSAALAYLKLDSDKTDPGYLNGGKYKVVEISAPDGYINDGWEEEIEIKWKDDPAERENVQIFSLPTKNGSSGNGSAEKAWRRANREGTLGNQPNKAVIRKTDDNGKAIPGVYFFIGTSKDDGDYLPYYWKTDGNTVKKVTPDSVDGTHLYQTDASGQIAMERLAAGTYYYQERIAPDGYAYDAAWHYFTVESDGKIRKEDGAAAGESITVTQVNHHAQPVDVTKTSSASDASNRMNGTEKQTFPEGTEFEIYEWDRDAGTYKTEPYVRMCYSTAKAQFVDRKTDGLPVVAYSPSNEGKYKIAETQATNGYVLDASPQEFTVSKTRAENEKPIRITFKNEPNGFRIKKISAKDGAPVSGVKYKVWKESQGHLYQEKDVTTDAKGYTKWFRGLAPGVWKFQETDVPEGYDADDSIHTFTVNTDGTIAGVQEDGTAKAEREHTEEVADTQTTTVTIRKKDARTGLEYDIDGSSFPDGTEFYIYEWDPDLNGGAGGYSETPKKHVIHATPTPSA